MKRLIYLWNHRNEIIEGWKNFLKLKYTDRFKKHPHSNEVYVLKPEIVNLENISKARLDVCKTCPFRESFAKSVEGNAMWAKPVEEDKCGLCGCPLKVKALSMPNAKWGEGGCPKKLW